MGEFRSVRLPGGALLILLLLVGGSCKRDGEKGAESLTASLMFDNASPDAREALASPVNFTITDDNFARWEKAQNNLEKLPRSAISTSPGVGRTAVDRAVTRLESSPYARTAIERTGLSVREFVLETIALAQAAEAAQTGKSVSGASIPRENFQFVQRYTARALYSGSRARIEGRTRDWDADAADVNAKQGEMDGQIQVDEAELQADPLADQQMQRDEIERQAEMDRQTRLPPPLPPDSVRDSVVPPVPKPR